MKYFINCTILFVFTSILQAQIGIFTENPQTLFHVDILKNNTAGQIPTVTEQKDDVYFGLDAKKEAQLSLSKLPIEGVQLLMNDPNKAFLPNKVALTSMSDIITVPNPVTGMMVYNTVKVLGNDGVIPGLYVFENNKWRYLFPDSRENLQMRRLQTSLPSPKCLPGDYSCPAILDFGNSIIIPENGAYGVGINLRCLINIPGRTITDVERGIVYIWLMANGVPVDCAELNIPIFPNHEESTYAVFLGGDFNVGDELTCRASNFTQEGAPTILMTDTSMIYWRLEQVSM